MGVQSLWDIVGPSARPVRLEALSRKKLAVDASIWIYQFLKAVRDKEGNALQSSHIVGFFRRICKLLFFGIRPIFVFDGGVPVLKKQTIAERKNRRQQKAESTRETAQKLLAMQLQKQLQGEPTNWKRQRKNVLQSSKKAVGGAANADDEKRGKYEYLVNDSDKHDDDPDEDDDDIIYFEDLPGNNAPLTAQTQSSESLSPEQLKSIKFRKKDEYHLPDLHEFKVSRTDQRIMADEDERVPEDDDFDHVDGININEVDPKSKEFSKLPIATQYMILNHLRLKSRLRMGYQKEQLQELFPSSMEFSKFQIQQVQKRNFYTQKLMNVTGMNDDVNVERRIAGDKDRKYALVKNEDGWTLALQGEGASATNPISLSDEELNKDVLLTEKPKIELMEKEKRIYSDAESDSDFEDVPLEEQEETEEEKQLQKALIMSIYEQYNEPEHSIGIEQQQQQQQQPSKGLQGFNTSMEDAVEASKAEYYKMVKEEADLEKQIEASSHSSSSYLNSSASKTNFGASLLFPNLQLTKEDVNANAMPSTLDKTADSAQNEHTPISSKSELGRSFIFSADNHETGKVQLKKGTGNNIDDNTQFKTQAGNKNGAITDFDMGRKSKKLQIDEAKETECLPIVKSVPKKEEHVVDDDDDIASELSDNDEQITKNRPAGQERLPDWFRNEVSQTLNPHNEKFVSSIIDRKMNKNIDDGDVEEYEDEEKAAGLIPWFEAKEYFETNDNEDDGKSNGDGYDNDADVVDVAEVAPPPPPPPPPQLPSLPPHSPSIIEADAPSKEQELPEKEPERKAAVIDYDFEEEDEDMLIEQMRTEEVDHELLKSKIKATHTVPPISSINTRITEEHLLQEKLQKAKRDSDEVTETMIYDVQELLKRFGIPFITAPMEAEAQCAELLKIGLVDGIVTDDSDCFLFGGDKVYKNMFNQKQFVECYFKDDIATKIGLSQDNLIELALLLGSDYTEGIKGVGPVLAMEILAEFGSLNKFKEWFDRHTKTAEVKSNLTSLEKNLLSKVKSGKLYLPDNFPDRIVFEAYKRPEVDPDKTDFVWGVPNLDQIRSFLMYNVGWSQERVDEVMIPLVRDLNKKSAEGVQSTIGEFFPQSYIQSNKELKLGKRMKTAANKLNKRKKVV
ncbi:conserved hypothetical protein [Lodderomyces elongisporus NRRL YB-4239]|uniref:DNA repair protein RAD2 n=1 Tax=Lodderomyces elongisporus (strain ATCC 11503 / CBS 2605 / JCM 1781 / NBRC 1676 / NRRL YB-4239) TaxID=379508 RepID=A5E4G0_LODEL|nr:conserved hypothetical protein [Lodderomyces elongisporus NRRL YB-4239]